MITKIKQAIIISWCFIKKFWIKNILRRGLSQEGKELFEYCKKVITEHYTPVSMRDLFLEEKINPQGLSGKSRIKWISWIYLYLWCYY